MSGEDKSGGTANECRITFFVSTMDHDSDDAPKMNVNAYAFYGLFVLLALGFLIYNGIHALR